MRIRASYLSLLGAVALAGCPTPVTTCPAGGPPPCIDIRDTGIVDAGVPGDTPLADVPRIDGGVGGCGTVGAAGGHCRGGSAGTCSPGFDCQAEIVAMTTGARLTIRSAFLIEQGRNPDPVTGFYEETPAAEAVPADDVPLPIASGSLCTQDCDVSAMTDACGTCATCDLSIGTAGILATYLLYGAMGGPFGDNTGWCRSDCMFDPAVAGATCPGETMAGAGDAHTCAPGSNTCVEGCVSDNECRFSFEQTRVGTFVTAIDDTSTATCSATTHRCEWTHASPNSVGDECDSNTDCTEDVGLCLRGGTCGEYECGRATDTDPATFVCDGGRGICLGNGGNMATICVQGCTMPSDCNPGSTCVPLGAGMTAGTFTGYCLGLCDSRLDDPDGLTGPMTAADDALIPCQTGEVCDYPDATADDLDPAGFCTPPCSTDADCTGDEGNYCDIIAGTDPAVGVCRWQDQVCNYEELSAGCYGQVCDLLAFDENLGLCVDACTADTDCDTGETCITAGGRGVCRTACTTTGPACPTGQTCQGTAAAGFYCEQMTVM